jgi:hypothetical protein
MPAAPRHLRDSTILGINVAQVTARDMPPSPQEGHRIESIPPSGWHAWLDKKHGPPDFAEIRLPRSWNCATERPQEWTEGVAQASTTDDEDISPWVQPQLVT